MSAGLSEHLFTIPSTTLLNVVAILDDGDLPERPWLLRPSSVVLPAPTLGTASMRCLPVAQRTQPNPLLPGWRSHPLCSCYFSSCPSSQGHPFPKCYSFREPRFQILWPEWQLCPDIFHLLPSPSSLCSPQDRPVNQRHVEARNTTLFGQPAD